MALYGIMSCHGFRPAVPRQSREAVALALQKQDAPGTGSRPVDVASDVCRLERDPGGSGAM